jgi:hypothetical protein
MTVYGWPVTVTTRPTTAGSSEATMPQGVAEDRHPISPLHIVRIRKQAAVLGTGTEDGEVVAADLHAVDAFGVVIAGKTHRLRLDLVRVDSAQRGRSLADVAVIRVRGGVEAPAALRPADVHEAVRFRETGQRPEEQRARDGEDGRVRADADRERQGGRDREQRASHQQTHGVARILEPGFEQGSSYEVFRVLRGTEVRGSVCPRLAGP